MSQIYGHSYKIIMYSLKNTVTAYAAYTYTRDRRGKSLSDTSALGFLLMYVLSLALHWPISWASLLILCSGLEFTFPHTHCTSRPHNAALNFCSFRGVFKIKLYTFRSTYHGHEPCSPREYLFLENITNFSETVKPSLYVLTIKCLLVLWEQAHVPFFPREWRPSGFCFSCKRETFG